MDEDPVLSLPKVGEAGLQTEETSHGQPIELPLPPDRCKGAKPYYEVLVHHSIIRYDSLRAVCDDLLDGKITRHTLFRQVALKPYSIRKSKTEHALQETALEQWVLLREWNPIGHVAAKVIPNIRQLYNPTEFYTDRARSVVFLATLLPLLVIAWVITSKWEGRYVPNQIRFRGMWDLLIQYPFFQKILVVGIGAVLATHISLALSFGIGVPVGRLIAWLRKGSHRVPPEDGYRSPEEVAAAEERQADVGCFFLLKRDALSWLLLIGTVVSIILAFRLLFICGELNDTVYVAMAVLAVCALGLAVRLYSLRTRYRRENRNNEGI